MIVSRRFWGRPDADIKLPAIFADRIPVPPGTPRCRILVYWNSTEEGEWDTIQPGKLQTFATDMKKKCIAASPPLTGEGRTGTKELIVLFMLGSTSDGGLAIPGVVNSTLISGRNGTMIPTIPLSLNLTDACQNRAEPVYEVELDGVSDISSLKKYK